MPNLGQFSPHAEASSHAAAQPASLAALGQTCIAHRLQQPMPVPEACFGLAPWAAKDAQRYPSGSQMPADAYLVHPGPYALQLAAQAETEMGICLQLVIDRAEPRLAQQRFELFLQSQDCANLELADVQRSLQSSLDKLGSKYLAAQTNHPLHPLHPLLLQTCPSHQEWQAYRAALEKILYLRFGFTVEDFYPCLLPIHYPEQLLKRDAEAKQKAAQATAKFATPQTADQTAPHSSVPDTSQSASQNSLHTAAQLARRQSNLRQQLFLQLPALCQAWRALPWPIGRAGFLARQVFWHKLDMLTVQLGTPCPIAANSECSANSANAAIQDAAADALELAWFELAQMQLLSRADFAAQAEAQLAAMTALLALSEQALRPLNTAPPAGQVKAQRKGQRKGQ